MTPHYADDAVTLYQGDCLDVLRALPDASVHAVITDPPYGLANTRPEQVVETIAAWIGGDREHLPGGSGFMGKAWDAFVPPVAVWDECLRILKPGGHLLAFAGSRTHDLMALGLRLAGFEIRDSIAWLYGSGFPKSRDVTEAMEAFLAGELGGYERPGAWGTALKPAFEPMVMARRPVEGGSTTRNVALYGTGALNIDACRTRMTGEDDAGRWPANIALDGDQARELDRQSGVSTSPAGTVTYSQRKSGHGMGAASVAAADPERKAGRREVVEQGYGDSGGASRYFPVFRYEPKAPTVERPKAGEVAHPTVKPLDLMRWLVRLVTPPGGVVLEPFAGSGTTAEACVIEGKRCIAIEREADYLPLIVNRLAKPIQIGLDLGEVG